MIEFGDTVTAQAVSDCTLQYYGCPDKARVELSKLIGSPGEVVSIGYNRDGVYVHAHVKYNDREKPVLWGVGDLVVAPQDNQKQEV